MSIPLFVCFILYSLLDFETIGLFRISTDFVFVNLAPIVSHYKMHREFDIDRCACELLVMLNLVVLPQYTN